MGSGSRFKVYRSGGFGLGLFVAAFPFALTISIDFAIWHVQIGFGKGYDHE